jgi:CNT family concentrative nucleoside transporter
MDYVWRIVSVGGLVAMIGAAYAMSTDRHSVKWKTVLWGIGLQLIFAVLILRTPVGKPVFQTIGNGVNGILECAKAGTSFVFGILGNQDEAAGYFDPVKGHAFFMAFQVLPIIIFVSSISAILYYFGVLQTIVKIMAHIMSKFMGTSGAESLSAAANVFVGMVEAPLVVRPYVERMTRSELFCLMVSGMATIAGNMLVIYAAPFLLGHESVLGKDAAGHLLAASVMSAPAAIAIAKLMIPETEEPFTLGDARVEMAIEDVNAIDAASRGAVQGLQIALNVAALLIVFIAFIRLANGLFGFVDARLEMRLGWTWFPSSLEQLLGWICAPIALVMGVPWEDATQVGSLLGTKVILNEFLAYDGLVGMMSDETTALSPRSVRIATYALCGFANLGSLGIMIAGVGSIAPSRRGDLARLGIKSIIAGSLAAFMTACIAGILT